jgi:hypothetical protein
MPFLKTRICISSGQELDPHLSFAFKMNCQIYNDTLARSNKLGIGVSPKMKSALAAAQRAPFCL